MNDSTAASINEKAAEEYFRKGQTAEKEAQHEKSVDFYERALNENPDHEQACFNLALLYDRRGDDTQAIELYERICTSAPVHLNALINLAVLYEDNDMYDEARRCLQAVLRTNYTHPRASLYMKDVESARSMFYDEDGERRGERRNAMLDTPVSDFELSVRSRNCLKKMDIRTLGDLLRVNEQELLGYKNFGETSLNEIKQLLTVKGLRLGQLSADGPGLPVMEEPAAGLPAVGGDAAPAMTVPFRRPAPATPEDATSELYARSVQDLELSVRSRKALQRLNINTLGELAHRTEDELLGCKNFGHTSLTEIKQALATHGVNLRRVDRN